MKKRLLALFLALAMTLGLAACSAPAADQSGDPAVSGDPTSGSPAPEGSPDPSTAPTGDIEVDLTRDILDFSAGLSPDQVVFTVNGADVHADFFTYWLVLNCATFNQSYAIYGLSLADYASMLMDDTVDMTAYYVLLREMCNQLGCPLTDEQRQTIHESMMQGGQEGYDRNKALFGLTDDSMEFIFAAYEYLNNLMGAVAPANPSEEQLNSYVYQTRHILLVTVDMNGTPVLGEDGAYHYPSLDEETVAQKRTLAEDLLARLQASDDPDTLFNELMNQYSEDTGLATNPNGYTATPGQMVPDYESASFALDFGEVSGIVESTYGYHIIIRDPVEDLSSYADDYREYVLTNYMEQQLNDAEIVRADLLAELNVPELFERFAAYQQAYVEANPEDAG